jgi:peptide/nickel transport system substrate-binding protein
MTQGHQRSLASLAVALVTLLAACAPATSGRGAATNPAAQPQTTAVPQRALVVAMSIEPALLEPSLLPQNREYSGLSTAFLTYFTSNQQAMPYLASEIPSVEKGTWSIQPDGRMQTTYTLRPNATWQDGQPITAQDFAFAFQVRMDPAFPAQSFSVERLLSNVVAVDDRTLQLDWKESYLYAASVHLPDFSPMHRQRLEPLYQEDKAAFVDGPHWREQFVGSGPYRLERWDPGLEMVFQAHPGFVLGAPKIEQVRIKFIPDANAIVANLLSKAVDMAFTINISFPQGQALEQGGFDGKVEYWYGNPRILEFQARDWGNIQRGVQDVRVRRAALYAIDRQAIVDGIYAGKAWVAHFWLPPTDPAFPAVDRAVTKYDFNPARAAALLAEAGWNKGADGVARNAAGDPLFFTLMNQPTEVDQQEAAVVLSDWKNAGIGGEIHRLSTQEMRDNELRAKYPGVAYNRRALTLENMVWISRQVARADNRWSGQNRNGYVNPALDEAWLKVLGATDDREREAPLVEAIRIMQDDAMVTLTHLQPDIMAYRSGLQNVQQASVVGVSSFWNIWDWRWT